VGLDEEVDEEVDEGEGGEGEGTIRSGTLRMPRRSQEAAKYADKKLKRRRRGLSRRMIGKRSAGFSLQELQKLRRATEGSGVDEPSTVATIVYCVRREYRPIP
jgi:hypothetical protein